MRIPFCLARNVFRDLRQSYTMQVVINKKQHISNNTSGGENFFLCRISVPRIALAICVGSQFSVFREVIHC